MSKGSHSTLLNPNTETGFAAIALGPTGSSNSFRNNPQSQLAPSRPSISRNPPSGSEKSKVQFQAQTGGSGVPDQAQAPSPSPRPSDNRSSNWDVFKKLEKGYEGYDPRIATEAHLAFADGDVPKNKVRLPCESII